MSPDGRHIRAACVGYNSLLAIYFLFLTSSRLGHYITEVPSKELLAVPLPSSCPDISSFTSFEDIDEFVFDAFSLTEADRAIVDDLLKVSLPDAIRKRPGPARKPTTRTADSDHDEVELSAYSYTLTRVLKSTFGVDKAVSVTIFQDSGVSSLPFRMVTVHLGWYARPELRVEKIESEDMLNRLGSFHRDVLRAKGGMSFQRVAFFFHTHEADGERVRNLTIIKPDEYRYWTRSQAMRDADELTSAILQAAGE